MSNLNIDHPDLFRNVRAKAVVHTAYGLTLLLLPAAPQPVERIVQHDASYKIGLWLPYFGVAYLIIGLLIFAGLYISKRNYSFARAALTAAAIYDVVWCLLLLLVFSSQPNRSIGWISIGYFYLTYRVWRVRNDPGWAAIELVKNPEELQELVDGSNQSTPQ